ncbi:MAG: AMP-binding protein [Thermoleophilia bacterium]
MPTYEEARAAFRLDVPARFNYALDVVDGWAAREPAREALVAVGPAGEHVATLTFADLRDRSNRVANALAAHGVGKGDRLLVVLPRVPEWYDVVLGAIKLGALPMPTTTQATARDLAYRIRVSEASAVVVDEDAARVLEGVRDELPSLRLLVVHGAPPADGWLRLADLAAAASDRAPGADPTAADDPMLLYFTSGTVAYPKMVLHTQASLGIGHQVTARWWHGLEPGDLHWTISDMGWAKAAWGMLFGQWQVGCRVFLLDQRGKPDVDLLLALPGRYGISTMCAPPTLFRAFVQQDLTRVDTSTLRRVLSAGEPLNPEVMRAWQDGTGHAIYEGYGQTETACLCATTPLLEVRPGSMGKPCPTYDVRILADDGALAAPGQEGRIAVRVAPERPVGLFREYWRDPEATAASFEGDWYLTGDRGTVDEDGYVWFVGRADDVIISASYRIGPFEVESALIEHPAVAEAAVVAKPDPARTSIVKAYVVLAPGSTASAGLERELQEHCKRVTAPYKYPREIDFVAELPKTISGKIRRTELRDRATAEAAGGA